MSELAAVRVALVSCTADDSVGLWTELVERLETVEESEFEVFRVLQAHILPLTNCAFNKSGDRCGVRCSCIRNGWRLAAGSLRCGNCYVRFITGSYDRTCKVWDTFTGREIAKLEDHKNVVYAIDFNNPFG